MPCKSSELEHRTEAVSCGSAPQNPDVAARLRAQNSRMAFRNLLRVPNLRVAFWQHSVGPTHRTLASPPGSQARNPQAAFRIPGAPRPLRPILAYARAHPGSELQKSTTSVLFYRARYVLRDRMHACLTQAPARRTTSLKNTPSKEISDGSPLAKKVSKKWKFSAQYGVLPLKYPL